TAWGNASLTRRLARSTNRWSGWLVAQACFGVCIAGCTRSAIGSSLESSSKAGHLHRRALRRTLRRALERMNATSTLLTPNSALVTDACAVALRAFYSAAQRGRWASRQGNVRQT